MNLYLITQKVNVGYNTFDAAVVAARNADEARSIHPYFDGDEDHHRELWEDARRDWVPSPEQVTATKIGRADPTELSRPCVVLASFNAG